MSPYGSADPARDWYNSAYAGMYPNGIPNRVSPGGSPSYPWGTPVFPDMGGVSPFSPGGSPSYPWETPVFPNMRGGGFPQNRINMPFSLDPNTWGQPTYTGQGRVNSWFIVNNPGYGTPPVVNQGQRWY